MSIHFIADTDTIDTIYRIILSVNQLSIYGAVAAICDEYEGQPDNTGEPVILEGQSIVLGEVKAEAPALEEPEDSNILLQKYFQQVRSLSPENRLSKLCKEAGFMSVVEVGQYFVTRNASEFLLKNSSLVANTHFLETIQLLNQKGGSEETRELDLFWKSQRAFSTSNSESKFEFNL